MTPTTKAIARKPIGNSAASVNDSPSTAANAVRRMYNSRFMLSSMVKKRPMYCSHRYGTTVATHKVAPTRKVEPVVSRPNQTMAITIAMSRPVKRVTIE